MATATNEPSGKECISVTAGQAPFSASLEATNPTFKKEKEELTKTEEDE